MRKQSALRKFTLAILAAVLCVLLAVGGIALGNGTGLFAQASGETTIEKHDGHKYHITVLKDETCVQPGLGVLHCEDCKASYNVVIPADGYSHKIENDKCEYCGETAVVNLQPHIVEGKGESDYYTVGKVANPSEAGAKVIVPGTYKGLPVKIADEAFKDNTNITEVVIKGVKEIPANAFSGCTGIETLTLEEGVETIAASAFSGCDALTEVTLPAGVTTLGANAFSGCDKLETVTLPEGITSIGANIFTGTKYALDPENWKTGALYNATYLLSVAEIPAQVAVAAAETPAPAPITFEVREGTTVIADNAFKSTSANVKTLEKVILPETLVTIGASAFKDLTKLTTVNLNALTDLKTIGANAFNGTALATIDLSGSANLTTIGNSAFTLDGTAAAKVKAIKLPDSVTEIGDSAFSNLPLTALTLPAKLESIGASAFAAATLKATATADAALELPATLKTIGEKAFEKAELTTLAIPESLTKIGANAFKEAKLTKLVIPATVKTIAANAFGFEADAKKSVSIIFSKEYVGLKDLAANINCYFTGSYAEYADAETEKPYDLGTTNVLYYSETEPLSYSGNELYWKYVDGEPAQWAKIKSMTAQDQVLLVGDEFVCSAFEVEYTDNTKKSNSGKDALLYGDEPDLTHYTVKFDHALPVDEDGKITKDAIGQYTITVHYLYSTGTYTLTVRAATHTITIDPNTDTEDNVTTKTVNDNESYTLPAASEYKVDKKFLEKWQVKIGESAAVDMKPGAEIEHVTEDIEISAVWANKTPEITLNFGEGLTADETKTLKAAVTATAGTLRTEDEKQYYTVTITVKDGADLDKARENYRFKAWDITVNGKKVELKEDAKTFDVAFEDTMTVVITAQWIAQYQVTVEPCDHATASINPNTKYDEGATVEFTVTVDSGYVLRSVSAAGIELPIKFTNGYYSFVINSNVKIKLEVEQVAVIAKAYDTDEKTELSVTPEITYNANRTSATVKIADPVKEGCVFVEWVVKVDGRPAQLNADGTLTVTVGNADVNVTFTAIWKNVYTVTIAVIGAEEGANPVTASFDVTGPYESGTKVSFSLAITAGYKLLFVKNGETALVAAADGKYTVTVASANITITVAVASTQKFAVTLNIAGDTAEGNTATLSAAEVNSGANVTVTVNKNAHFTVAVTAKAGTADVAVKANQDGTTYTIKITAATTITVTFTAHYEVVFAEQDGVTMPTLTDTEKSATKGVLYAGLNGKKATKTHYTFLYWFYNTAEGEVKVELNTEGKFVLSDAAEKDNDGNAYTLTLYAKFMSHPYPAQFNTDGYYVCKDGDTILRTGRANNSFVPASLLTVTGSSIVNTGLTVSFQSSTSIVLGGDDWNAVALISGEGNLRISLPNLDPWNITANLTGEGEEALAAKLRNANAIPGADELVSGASWDGFNGESFVTIVVSKTGGVTFYKNGAKYISYAASRGVGTGTVADLAELFLCLAARTGMRVATGNTILSASDVSIIKDALTDEEVAANYATYQVEKAYYPEVLPAPTPAYTLDTAITAQGGLTIGKNGTPGDDTQGWDGYSNNPNWIGKLEKGQKIVISGTQKAAANQPFWSSLTVFAWSGFKPSERAGDTGICMSHANPPADVSNWGGAASEAWSVTRAAPALKGDTDFNALIKEVGADCTTTITFDWTQYNKQFSITMKVEKGDKSVEVTYLFTEKDNMNMLSAYNIGIGVDHSYANLTSITRTTKAPTKDFPDLAYGSLSGNITAGNYLQYIKQGETLTFTGTHTATGSSNWESANLRILTNLGANGPLLREDRWVQDASDEGTWDATGGTFKVNALDVKIHVSITSSGTFAGATDLDSKNGVDDFDKLASILANSKLEFKLNWTNHASLVITIKITDADTTDYVLNTYTITARDATAKPLPERFNIMLGVGNSAAATFTATVSPARS